MHSSKLFISIGVWGCPSAKCGTEIEKDFPFESTLESQDKIEKHQKFKKRLQMFFLDVLRQYVFDADNCPDEEVTKLMMSFVVTTKLPKDKASQRKVRTKNISPFEGLEYSENMTHFPCILIICLQKTLILLV